ncbi:MAG: RluA family pseudouridine synthase, partial [Tissierellia bacterium]|nr:RluA family pseudouridine synthase [Tissierellia bacterium]
ISKNIADANIKVNGQKVKNSYKLNIGDEISGFIEEDKILAEPEDIKIDIVYEDQYIIAVNKAYDMVVHPCVSTRSGTLVNALLNYTENLSSIGGEYRRGIVHRLDKDTTGLLIIAKDDFTHEKMVDIFKNRRIIKRYLAIVHGCPREEVGIIDKAIGRDKYNRTRMAVTEFNSKDAVTEYRTLNSNGQYSLLEIDLHTGRTHQIRVHLSHIGNPIVGDSVYGRKKEKINVEHQLLHSHYLEFIHPMTGQTLKLNAKPDNCFINSLEKLNLRYDY